MTDPNASAQDDYAPPKPPRPSATQRQLEADELYARQLAEHYNRRAQPPRGGDEAYRRQRHYDDAAEEKEYNFFDGAHVFMIFCVLVSRLMMFKTIFP